MVYRVEKLTYIDFQNRQHTPVSLVPVRDVHAFTQQTLDEDTNFHITPTL